MDSSKGMSAIVINTEKGEFLWNSIESNLVYKKSSTDLIAKYNGSLIAHSEKPVIRDIIYKAVRERGYADVAKNEFRCAHYNRLVFKELVKKIPGLIKLVSMLRSIK